jgi:hypothetical protein
MKSTPFFTIALILTLFCSCKPNTNKRNSVSGLDSIVPETYIKSLDSVIVEISGLLLWDNHFWTFNDSGGKNEIYGLDFINGKILFTIQLTNAKNIDWEDIAQDEKYIYIAESGNNAGVRHDLKILRIKKKDITSYPFQSVMADSISFRFADQKDFTPVFRQTPYDCEALMVYNDSCFVFTKDWIRNITKVYGFPSEIGNYSPFPIDSFNANGLITGADILPNGKYALIGYKNFRSFFWTFRKTKSNFFSNPRFIDLGMLVNAQTEGICFTSEGDLFFSCERTENYNQQIWKIGKKQLNSLK